MKDLVKEMFDKVEEKNQTKNKIYMAVLMYFTKLLRDSGLDREDAEDTMLMIINNFAINHVSITYGGIQEITQERIDSYITYLIDRIQSRSQDGMEIINSGSFIKVPKN